MAERLLPGLISLLEHRVIGYPLGDILSDHLDLRHLRTGINHRPFLDLPLRLLVKTGVDVALIGILERLLQVLGPWNPKQPNLVGHRLACSSSHFLWRARNSGSLS